MNDDIRPPQRPKIKTPKSPPPESANPLPPKPALPPKPDFVLEDALAKPERVRGASNFSKNPVKNLKNLHPKHWYNLSRAEKFMTLGGFFIILVAVWVAGLVLYTHVVGEPPSIIVHKKHAPAAPATVASPLTGLQVDPALAKRPVTAIMIENSLDARPQSGLQDAGVVFEAIAEGGVTRFMGLFQETQPQYIGPVRSLRPYYIHFAEPFDASIAHVGGSPDALAEIRNGGKDLDQFFNSGAYWRQPTRPAPHNVYTSFARLDALNAKKGYTSSNVQSWDRKKDSPLKVPTAKTISMRISGVYYDPSYVYNPTTNSYLRSENKAAHINVTSATDKTGVQLQPKVVIALVMGLSNGALDASGAYYSDYQDTGSGTAFVFQDGGVTEGSWTKTDNSSQFVFTDTTGKEIKLDAGQTWVSIVTSASAVTYAP